MKTMQQALNADNQLKTQGKNRTKLNKLYKSKFKIMGLELSNGREFQSLGATASKAKSLLLS